MPASRAELLRSLIAYELPIEPIVASLGVYGWDAEQEEAWIEPKDVARVLRRFLDGHLTSDQVLRWANLLECRDDLGYRTRGEYVKEVIYVLANPELQGELTVDLASAIAQELECFN